MALHTAGSSSRIAFFLAVSLAACSSPEHHRLAASSPLFTNGSFETGPIGTPPTGWIHENYRFGGLTGAPPPQSVTDLNLGIGGDPAVISVGAATPEANPDPDLGAGPRLRYPKFGLRSVVINGDDLPGSIIGRAQNVNAIRQQMTVGNADRDADGSLHIRFAAAPVFEFDAGHTDDQQPFFYYELRNITKNTLIFHDYQFAGQAGMPWQAAGALRYTDWQAIDIAPGTAVANGDVVELAIYAGGCSAGDHWGRVYVDGVGRVIPGLFATAAAPAGARKGSIITYKLTYWNGGDSDAVDAMLDFVTPANTTFIATDADDCTTPASGATGTVSCPVGTLGAHTSGSFSVIVKVDASFTGALATDYSISATDISPVLGARVTTRVSGPPHTVEMVSGDAQSAAIGAAFAHNLVALVKDEDDNPVFDARVSFTAGTVGGATATLAPAGGRTDITGVVSTTATASGATGSYSVTASATGATDATFSLTNIPPPTIVLTSGDAQTVTITTPYPLPMVVTVNAAGNTPQSGIAVTFTAPPTGASITAPTTTVVTDLNGRASMQPTANATSGAYTVVASIAGGAPPVTFHQTNRPDGPATMTIVSGDAQSAVVDTAYASALTVLVVDASGNPVPDVAIDFDVPATGASVTPGDTTIATNASGHATYTATANRVSGPFQITAKVQSLAILQTFNLTNRPGDIAQLTKLSADNQTAVVDTFFAAPIEVQALDQFNNAVPFVPISCATTGHIPGPIPDQALLFTDGSGRASIQLKANQARGSYTFSFIAPNDVRATFQLTNHPDVPFSFTGGSHTGRSDTTVATSFSLYVHTLDRFGNPVSNQTLAFEGPNTTTAPSITPISGALTTDANGYTDFSPTANHVAGGTYQITVSALTVPAQNRLIFTVRNTPDAPHTVTILDGETQSTTVNTAFSTPLSLQVTDQFANVIPNVGVGFSVPSSGASAVVAVGTTEIDGKLTVTASANTRSGGPYPVRASTPNGRFADFAFTNDADVPSRITAQGGDSQTTIVNRAFAVPLQAFVEDQFGNPVPLWPIDFTGPTSPAPALEPNTSTLATGSDGMVSLAAVANTKAGAFYDISATVRGFPTKLVKYRLTNLHDDPAIIANPAGNHQHATVATAYASQMTIQVQDQFTNPIAGANVTFTPPATGASATVLPSQTAVTDANGEAVVLATANTVAASFAIGVTVAGFPGAVGAISLTNDPGPPASFTAVGPTSYHQPVHTVFPELAVRVRDVYQNLVPGAIVHWAATAVAGATASLSGASSTADAGAVARITATAGSVRGSYAVNATVEGIQGPVVFALTNDAGAPSTITVQTGDAQSAVVGTAFATEVAVVVTDADGNLADGVTVSFTGAASGPSTAPQQITATTDASGTARVTLTANTVAGLNAVAVTAGAASTQLALVNLAGPPASIAASGPTTSAGVVGTAFATPLAVVVRDAHDNVIDHADVIFEAPLTGASLTPATSTTPTDASGIASLTPHANHTAGGPYTVTAAVAGVTPRVSFSVTNTAGAAASVAIAAGDQQSSPANTAFAEPLDVRVVDAFDNPVPSATVTFEGPQAGASISPRSIVATTDANGRATAAVTANAIAGALYAVTANVAGATGATFHLTNTANQPATITAQSGTGQHAATGTAFSAPLVVEVKDADGNLVGGAPVTFTAPPDTEATAGFAPQTIATTNAQGIASLPVTAGRIAGGPYTVTATAALGVSTTFELSNDPGAPGKIVLVSGGAQHTDVHQPFALPIRIKVTDAFDNIVVPGTPVAFTAPPSGPSATVSIAPPTDALGETSVTATANAIAGAYQLTATAGAAQLGVDLVNDPAAVARIVVTSGDGQTAIVTAGYAQPLRAEAQDADGNRVPGVPITFTPPATGASLAQSATTVTTDASGLAQIAATANTIAGGFDVVVSSGQFAPTRFRLTNQPGAPASVVGTAGTAQFAAVGTAFDTPLTVVIKDAHDNLVPGVAVAFTAPTTGFSIDPATGSATSDASGQAALIVTANHRAGGPYRVTAQVIGVIATARFDLVNLAGAPSVVRVISGDAQTATVGTVFARTLSVKVEDAFGNATNGADVSFTAPSQSAASLSQSSITVPTDAVGRADLTVTANTHAGAYDVAAAIAGGTTPASFHLTNAADAPASITAMGGTPQSTTVATAFLAPLVVVVKDQHDNPVQNATVTFAAPAAGASLDASSATQTTDAQGRAQLAARANSVAGAYTVSAGVTGVAPSAAFALDNSVGAVDRIVIVAGDAQTATVGAAFAQPLRVRVEDVHGNPVPSQHVTFTAPPAHLASLTVASTVIDSDASGLAEIMPTANHHAGADYAVIASVGSTAASFHLTNRAAAAHHLALDGSPGRSAVVATAFDPLAVVVTDAFDNPVLNEPVTFTATMVGGATATVAFATVTTDADGRATALATANQVAGGPYELTAALTGGARTSFVLTNAAGAGAVITAAGGDHQRAVVRTGFATPLTIRVTDAFGNPIEGAEITWAAPDGGASAALSTSTQVTDASGEASITATANMVRGAYIVTAVATGIGTADFDLQNDAGGAAAIRVVSGDVQSATVGTAFHPLIAAVVDADENAVPEVRVTFAAPAGGPSLTTPNLAITTDEAGHATLSATANTIVGAAYVVTASVAGVQAAAAFHLTNTAGAGTNLVIVGGGEQSTIVDTNFGSPLQVVLTDSENNPVPETHVTFTVTAADGASATLSALTATTDAAGHASVTATAGRGAGGPYTVTATSQAGGSATFSLTNRAAAPSSITVVQGDAQLTSVGEEFPADLEVVVADTFDNPVAGAQVSFAVPPADQASAELAPASPVVTDARGIARVTATANARRGVYQVTAHVSGVATGATFTLRNNAGAPATITTLAGTGQAAVVGTGFAQQLVVEVRDAGGNPVDHAVVQFTVAAPGAGASFQPSPATTDDDGRASVIATANAVAGSYTITATSDGVAAPASFAMTNTPGAAARIRVVSGSGQATAVASPYAAPVVFEVNDALGNPVAGVTVSFSAPRSGRTAWLSSTRMVSDAHGQLVIDATASTLAGTFQIRASIVRPDAPAFAPRAVGVLRALADDGDAIADLGSFAGPPASLRVVSGGLQTGLVSSSLAPLVVLVVDEYGNPCAGASVGFTAPSAQPTAQLSHSSVVTDANGLATIAATAGNSAGSYAITAALTTGQQTDLRIANSTTQPLHLAVVSPTTTTTTTVATPVAQPVIVAVTSSGAPVAGAQVIFTPPAHGATATLSAISATTDALGHAQVTAVAGTQIGSYAITAYAQNGELPVEIPLVNAAGAPAAIEIADDARVMASKAGEPFTGPLVARVVDAYGNPVAGVSVSFTAPPTGATAVLAQPSVVTDSLGEAVVSATASAQLGDYEVTAAVTGLAGRSFALKNLPEAPDTVQIVSGSPQTGTVGASLAPITVRVLDPQGAPRAGAVVSFATAASGPTGIPASPSATTDASGIAQIGVTAGTRAGRYVLAASVASGAIPATFRMANAADGPASVEASAAANPQTARVGASYPLPLLVTVVDRFGNPVSGVTVSFASPASGATATLPGTDPVTDAAGQASVVAVASAGGGSFAVTATASGVAPAVFTLTNRAGDPSSIATIAGGQQSATATTAFAPIHVRLDDSFGNPVGDALVTVLLPASGASGTAAPPQVFTDADGVATIAIIANGVPGAFQATFHADGAAAPATAQLVVSAIATQIRLAVDRETTVDATLQLSATVSGTVATPTGTLRFLVDGVEVGAAPLDGGEAAIAIPAPAIGEHMVTARYDAQGAFAMSAAQGVTVNVADDAGTLGGGCTVAGGPVNVLAVVVVIAALVRRRRRRAIATIVIVVGAIAGGRPASAQSMAEGADIATFHASAAGSEWFSADSLDLAGPFHLTARLMPDFAHRPLVVYDADGSMRFVAVAEQMAVHAGLSLVLTEGARLSLGIPLTVFRDGDAGIYNGQTIDPQASLGAGDLTLGADIRIANLGLVALAAGLTAELPTGSQGDFLGNGAVGVVPHVAAAGGFGPLAYAGQLGFALRSGRIANVSFNDEVRFAAAGGVRLLDDHLLIGPEVFGAIDIASIIGIGDGPTRAPSVEASLGAHYQMASGWRAGLGVGTGLTRAPGVPEMRVLVSLDWSPTERPARTLQPEARIAHSTPPAEPVEPAEPAPVAHESPTPPIAQPPPPPVAEAIAPAPPDRDGDLVADAADACPDVAGAPNTDAKQNGCPGLVTVAKGQITITQQIQFRRGQDEIHPRSFPALQAVANALIATPAITKLSIEGHTDALGNPARNIALSQRRADSVMRWLVAHGVAAERLEAHGFGSTRQVADSSTHKGRVANRRVEFRIVSTTGH